MTLEGYTIIIDLAGLRQRKNLETTRVSEHGTVPLHEFVQAAHVADKFVTGTQVEMIGVAQNKRGVDVLEMLRRESLDRRLRADGREDRRDEVAVRRGENPRAGAVVHGSNLEVKHRADYTIFGNQVALGIAQTMFLLYACSKFLLQVDHSPCHPKSNLLEQHIKPQ